MKKFFTYISILMAGMAVSCIQNAEPEAATDFALSLEAQVTDLETRSPGVDSLKENTITAMDWFFFSDEEGTTLLYHTSTNNKTLDLDNATVTANGLSGVSYLYAVANGPEGISEKTTLADILVMPVSMTYTKQVPDPDDDNKPYNKLDKDHLGFIMDTYNKETGEYLQKLTPKQVDDGVTGSKQETIAVPLSRLAAKITPVVKIKKSVQTRDSFGNTENWTPILNNDDFDVYMLNALKAGKMDGVPVRRADEGVNQDDYFDYGRNVTDVMDITPESGDYYIWRTVHPFYTYPQTWNDTDNFEPYIKVIFPWMSSVKGSAEFHYKIVLPQPKDKVFTLERNCWYQLTATIAVLGGAENDYVLIDDVEVSVADWAEPSWFTGTGLNSAKFFYVPTKVFDVYSMDSFNIPINTNSSAKAYITKIEFSDYSASPTHDLVYSKGGRLGNSYVSSVSADDIITGNNGDDRGVRFSGTEHNYSVTVNSTDRYNKFVTLEHSMADIYVMRTITIYIEHSERSEWHETVIIHQHPAIELKKAVDDEGNLIAGDLFVNGRFACVKNASFGAEHTRQSGGVNYVGYHSRNGWTSFSSYYGLLSNDINPSLTSTNIYGCLIHDGYVTWVDRPFFLTDITVSAFSESNDHYKMSVNGGTEETINYKIGDPRVKVNTIFKTGATAPFNQTWSLDQYLTGEHRQSQYSNTWIDETTAWSNPGDILVASNDENTRNMIAPHFLVSSGLTEGVQGYAPDDFVSYFKRGATYQEAGYPAGRWRLPTEAEIAFIAARQYDGTIPKIFNVDVPYFASSGRFVIIPSDKTKPIAYFTYDRLDDYYTIGSQRVRYRELVDAKFIYDVWYWGETPEAPNVYHANGHIE